MADNVIKGWKFFADLTIHTPLHVLERHGTFVEDAASANANWNDGFWVPVTKSWEELGLDPADFEDLESMLDATIGAREVNTQFGFFPYDGGDLLLFLKIFRRIVESEMTTDQKVIFINRAVDLSPIRGRLLQRADGDFARFWFATELTKMPGVGKVTACRLFDASLRTAEEALAADETLLKSIEGIGPATIRRIKSFAS